MESISYISQIGLEVKLAKSEYAAFSHALANLLLRFPGIESYGALDLISDLERLQYKMMALRKLGHKNLRGTTTLMSVS